MAAIDLTSGSASAYGAGELQLQNKVQMTGTLTPVTDNLNVASPLLLSTSLVQTTSTLKITTSDVAYIDAEDNSGNNRFTVSRASASQLVTVDFASVPTALTTPVGAIRTATDGVNLANVMTFLENGNIGFGTDTPTNTIDIERTTGNSTLNIQGNGGVFISVKRFSNNATRPRYELYKSRGTIASPLVVATSDDLGSVDFYGYDGSANQRVGILYVNAESVVGATITPQMAFGLGTSAAANIYRMVIKNDGNVTIGNDLTTLGARLGIKGSGSTSATTSFLIQDSAATNLMNIRDDGYITLFAATKTGQLDIQGGASSGVFAKAYNSQVDNIIRFKDFNGNASMLLTMTGSGTGNLTINNSTTSLSATLGVKGSGTTGATTSLLVQNSAGTAALTITDDRVVTIGNYIAFANGDLIVPSNSSGALELRPIVSKVLLKGATAINTTAAMPVASAMLDIVSTTSGFLPPRMTTAQKNAIATPAAGLMVYDSTLNKLCVYTTAWETITSV